MQPPADRADTHTGGFFFSFLFLFPASFAVSFSTLPVCVFHLHLPLFIGSETKAPALVVVLAAVRSASRGKSFSLHSSSLHRRVRSFIPKMLMGSHIAVDLWREALQCLYYKASRAVMNSGNSHTRHYSTENCAPRLDQAFIPSLQLQLNFKGYSRYTGIYPDVCGVISWTIQHPNCWKLFWKPDQRNKKTKKLCWKARWRLFIKFRITILKSFTLLKLLSKGP